MSPYAPAATALVVTAESPFTAVTVAVVAGLGPTQLVVPPAMYVQVFRLPAASLIVMVSPTASVRRACPEYCPRVSGRRILVTTELLPVYVMQAMAVPQLAAVVATMAGGNNW